MSLAEKELVVMAGADDVKAALGEMGVVTTGMGIADYGDAIRSIESGCPALPDLVAGGTYKKTDNTPVTISAISGETTAIRLLVAATGPMKTALILTLTGSPVIDWGDGTTTSPTNNTAAVHTYDGVNPIPCGRPWGVYYITITGGTVSGMMSSQTRDDWGGAVGNIVAVAVKSSSMAIVNQLVASSGATVRNYAVEDLYYNLPNASTFVLGSSSTSLLKTIKLAFGAAIGFGSFINTVTGGLAVLDLSAVKILGNCTLTSVVPNVTSVLFNPANTELGNIDIQYNSLSVSGFVAMFNSLPTVTAKTIQIGGSAAALALTAEQIAIATGKGWTVTRSY